MSAVTEETRAKAEVWYENETCQQKVRDILNGAGLPNGLLPLKNIEECGYVKETGFVWMKLKEMIERKFEKLVPHTAKVTTDEEPDKIRAIIEHSFSKIGMWVSYSTVVTAYVREKMMREVQGVKVKKIPIFWTKITEIYVGRSPSDDNLLIFNSSNNNSKTFPVSAFQIA